MKGNDTMKKISIIILLVVVICFSSCQSVLSEQNNKTTTNSLEISHTQKNHNNNSTSNNQKDFGGADITPRKYRACYYSVPYPFALLVGVDQYWKWHEMYNNQNPDDTNEMVIKKFVQYFDISREDFEKSNLAFAKIRAEGVDDYPVMNPKDYADQEPDEIYNADIIYTFDDKTINDYYLTPNYAFGWRLEYEEAVANGTYQTRTTDWVDVEQMEAEIIAKYGEAEIVAETTLAPYEIPATDLPQSEITE